MFQSARYAAGLFGLAVALAAARPAAATELQAASPVAIEGRFVRGGAAVAIDDSWPALAPTTGELRLNAGGLSFGEPGDRLVYFTPRGGGLALFAGADEIGKKGPQGAFGESPGGWSTRAGVEHRMGDLHLWSGGSLTSVPAGGLAPPGDGIDKLRVGGGVDYGNFHFGGAVETAAENSVFELPIQRQHGFDLGAKYEFGQFTTGIAWSRGFFREVSRPSGGGTMDELMLSLSYRLGHSLDLIGALQYDTGDARSGSAGRTDTSGAFIFGTAIRF